MAPSATITGFEPPKLGSQFVDQFADHFGALLGKYGAQEAADQVAGERFIGAADERALQTEHQTRICLLADTATSI